MQKDEDIDAIFVNIYSGIVPADKMSIVICDAVQKGWVSKPIVARIKGSFAEGANSMLHELAKSNPLVHVIEDLDEAAQKVVKLTE